MFGSQFKRYASTTLGDGGIRDVEAFMGVKSEEDPEASTLVDRQWLYHLERMGYPYVGYNERELTESVVGKKCVTRTLSACKGRDRIAGEYIYIYIYI
jgi:hypothetical protein